MEKTIAFKPIGDRILVDQNPAETVTASGIIIPEVAQQKTLRGKVIAVGSGKKDDPMTIEVGDTVIYGEYSGEEIELEGKTYLAMTQSDVHGIIK